ncbi:MAG: hypothetical protein H7138_26525, partial [Myxococcales bacterium]|nr:hypothetical protein [Myxococcales bacterium]
MKRLLLPVGVGILAAACSTGPGGPTQAPDEPDTGSTELSASAIAQIESLIQEKAARTPAQRKISSALLYAKSDKFAAATSDRVDPARRITPLHQTDTDGRVLVDVQADMAKLGGQIEALGGKVVSSSKGSARAWLALGQVEALAAQSAVKAIRPALQAMTHRAD